MLCGRNVFEVLLTLKIDEKVLFRPKAHRARKRTKLTPQDTDGDAWNKTDDTLRTLDLDVVLNLLILILLDTEGVEIHSFDTNDERQERGFGINYNSLRTPMFTSINKI